MEDDKIKDLFSNFNPEISSSFQFMSELKKNMERVEILKQHNRVLRKRNRWAVIIAAASGFVMGIILSLLMPIVVDWLPTLNISIPHSLITNLAIDYNYPAWIITAAVSVITAVNAYEIALALLSKKKYSI